MVIKKIKPQKIGGKEECFEFYSELVRGIKKGKFFREKRDFRYDEFSKKEATFISPNKLVTLIVNISSMVGNWKWKDGKAKATNIKWVVTVFISGINFDPRISHADDFLNYVKKKIYEKAIIPSIVGGTGFVWSTKPKREYGELNIINGNPMEVSKQIEQRVKKMITIFDGAKKEIGKSIYNINLLSNKIVDEEKKRIDSILFKTRR